VLPTHVIEYMKYSYTQHISQTLSTTAFTHTTTVSYLTPRNNKKENRHEHSKTRTYMSRNTYHPVDPASQLKPSHLIH
jgi:hypothetical protein